MYNTSSKAWIHNISRSIGFKGLASSQNLKFVGSLQKNEFFGFNHFFKRTFCDSTLSTKKFPLFFIDEANATLFPGCFIPLRIFEAKYHLLMQDVSAGKTGFGMVTGRKSEVNFPIPAEYGTMAILEEYKEKPDGPSEALVKGGKRFKIIGRPDRNFFGIYEGDIEVFDDTPDDKKNLKEGLQLAKEVEQFMKIEIKPDSLKSLETNKEKPSITNPTAYSFWVCSVLPCDKETKLKYLSSTSMIERLSAAKDYLKARDDVRQKNKQSSVVYPKSTTEKRAPHVPKESDGEIEPGQSVEVKKEGQSVEETSKEEEEETTTTDKKSTKVLKSKAQKKKAGAKKSDLKGKKKSDDNDKLENKRKLKAFLDKMSDPSKSEEEDKK